jgi:hypothetical protein
VLALRVDHFQAQAQVARVAPAQHGGAAGVGGQVAAQGAAAFGRQAQGEQQAARRGRFLHGLQHAAALGGDSQVGLVKKSHAVHALQAQQHLGAAGVGHAAAHQAGVAALGHDGHLGVGTQPHHRGHLGRGAGAHHRQRFAVPAAAPVAFKGTEVAFGQHVAAADRGTQPLQQFGAHGAAAAAAAGAERKRQRM